MPSKCAVCGNKKSKFIKEQVKELLSSLGIKTLIKTFHRTIEMKPIKVKSNSYAVCNVDSNEKIP